MAGVALGGQERGEDFDVIVEPRHRIVLGQRMFAQLPQLLVAAMPARHKLVGKYAVEVRRARRGKNGALEPRPMVATARHVVDGKMQVCFTPEPMLAMTRFGAVEFETGAFAVTAKFLPTIIFDIFSP